MAEFQRRVPADHPALPGHFPGAPLVPGVVLLDWAWEACRAVLPAGARLTGVISAKFLLPVVPEDVLLIQAEPAASHVDFKLSIGDTLVAQGRFGHG